MRLLNLVTCNNSGRPHKIVRANVLHDVDDIIIIERFEVKIVGHDLASGLLLRNFEFILQNILTFRISATKTLKSFENNIDTRYFSFN